MAAAELVERIFPLLHLADLAEEVLHLTEMVKLTLAVADPQDMDQVLEAAE